MDSHVGKGVHFERIRRITGYLVGALDRFNNAKRAEEHDRVKHVSMKKFRQRRGRNHAPTGAVRTHRTTAPRKEGSLPQSVRLCLRPV